MADFSCPIIVHLLVRVHDYMIEEEGVNYFSTDKCKELLTSSYLNDFLPSAKMEEILMYVERNRDILG